jgi:hypothetical protein
MKLLIIQRISPCPRLLVNFRDKIIFYGEELLAPRPIFYGEELLAPRPIFYGEELLAPRPTPQSGGPPVCLSYVILTYLISLQKYRLTNSP